MVGAQGLVPLYLILKNLGFTTLPLMEKRGDQDYSYFVNNLGGDLSEERKRINLRGMFTFLREMLLPVVNILSVTLNKLGTK